MLHVHVLSNHGVIASEPGDPDNWVELSTVEPGPILEHFWQLSPVPPRMMHVTFNDGEFSAESGAELVVDTLDCFAFSSSTDVNQHGKLVRVWASGSKAPLAKYKHQHAKPARMMPVADLLSLRDGFLKDECEGEHLEKLGTGTSYSNPLNLRETGGDDVLVDRPPAVQDDVPPQEDVQLKPSPEEQQLLEELSDMRKVFTMANFDGGPPIIQQPDVDATTVKRLEAIEVELSNGHFGPLITFEDGCKVYRQCKKDAEGNTIRAVKIKPVAFADEDGVVCLRNNTVASVDYPDGSRLSEEVTQTKKIGDGFQEYAHMKNTRKSKRLSSNIICWCKQEFRHKVPAVMAPGTMNVESCFEYLLNTQLFDADPDKIDTYMDDEGRAVRKTKRMQRSLKTGPDGEKEDCWTSWVVKETKDPLDGAVVSSNKQRETRMSQTMLHHVMHNVTKSVVEEGSQIVTTVTILVVHRMEPFTVKQAAAEQASPSGAAATSGNLSPNVCSANSSTNVRALKGIQQVLDSLGSESNEEGDEGGGCNDQADFQQKGCESIDESTSFNHVREPPYRLQDLGAAAAANDQTSAGVQLLPAEVILERFDDEDMRDAAGASEATTAPTMTSWCRPSTMKKSCDSERSGRDRSGREVSRHKLMIQTALRRSGGSQKRRPVTFMNQKEANRGRSKSTAKNRRSSTSRNLGHAARAISGDEEQYGEECPPDEYDELLNEVNALASPTIPDAEIAEIKRKKVQEELKKRWSSTVSRISLGELFLSMPRTTKTHLLQAHTELAQAKMAAMALRFNYGVQEKEQGACPRWCTRRMMKRP